MLDNNLLRFIVLGTLFMLLFWALRRFFSGWKAMTVEDIASDDMLGSIEDEQFGLPEEDSSKFRSAKSASGIQQELEAPVPDELMAEPTVQHHDITKRIQQDTASVKPKRKHTRPHRNSRPAKGRKIQL